MNEAPSRGYILQPGDSRRDLGPFRILVDGAEHGRRLALYTGALPRGGPPLHTHADFDEALLLIEGRLLVHLDGEERELSVGSFMWMPRGSVHTFANPDDTPVTALGLAAPDGILPLFAERGAYMGGLAKGAAPDRDRIAEIYRRHASMVLGPPLLGSAD